MTFLHRNPVQRLPKPVLAFALRCVFLALDYLHTEYRVVYNGRACSFDLEYLVLWSLEASKSGIRADDFMFEILDDSVLVGFGQDELGWPCPREELDDRVIYTSRQLKMLCSVGAHIFCDFGSAVPGGKKLLKDIQSDIKSSGPESSWESRGCDLLIRCWCWVFDKQSRCVHLVAAGSV